MSNDFKFLMLAGRLFHSLSVATEWDLPVDRSPLYKGTTSPSRAFVDWDYLANAVSKPVPIIGFV